MAPDNTLQDCDVVAEGSAIDSEIIQDYKKGNQKHLQLNPNKTSKKVKKCLLISTRSGQFIIINAVIWLEVYFICKVIPSGQISYCCSIKYS